MNFCMCSSIAGNEMQSRSATNSGLKIAPSIECLPFEPATRTLRGVILRERVIWANKLLIKYIFYVMIGHWWTTTVWGRHEMKIKYNIFVSAKKSSTHKREKASEFSLAAVDSLCEYILCMHVILSRRCSSIVICGNNSATRRSRLARESESHIRHKKKFYTRNYRKLDFYIYIFSGVLERRRAANQQQWIGNKKLNLHTDRSLFGCYLWNRARGCEAV